MTDYVIIPPEPRRRPGRREPAQPPVPVQATPPQYRPPMPPQYGPPPMPQYGPPAPQYGPPPGPYYGPPQGYYGMPPQGYYGPAFAAGTVAHPVMHRMWAKMNPRPNGHIRWRRVLGWAVLLGWLF